MTATSHYNGWPTEWCEQRQVWVWSDTKQPIDGVRPCKHCGLPPTPEGYDGCLGYLPGVVAACCGHGVEPPYVLTEAEWLEAEGAKGVYPFT
jgi:hypothetical protein